MRRVYGIEPSQALMQQHFMNNTEDNPLLWLILYFSDLIYKIIHVLVLSYLL